MTHFKPQNLLVLLLVIGLISCEIDDSPIQVVDTNTVYKPTTDGATNRPALEVIDVGQGTGSITWTADQVILLNGFVFVNAGQTLQIEAGTVIKGLPGIGEQASALVVARGGRIIAEGTQEAPIIFTASSDDLDGNLGSEDRGLWGGLIVLGAAQLNSEPGVNSIEGIPENEPRGVYGGSNDNDDSGILRYISIRHGGSDIGDGNEINGLTLAAVGQQTQIDYIEVYGNQDDGIEFFGGTAQVSHFIAAHCADDGIDYDEGFRGNLQFGLIYQSETVGGDGGEHDGGTSPEDGLPYAIPNIYNITSIGGSLADNRSIVFKDNAGGKYHNSLFINYVEAITIELLASGEHSYKRLQTDDLQLKNNVFWNVPTVLAEISIGSNVTTEEAQNATNFLNSYLSTNNNQLFDLGVRRDQVVPDPHTITTSPAPSTFFQATDYIGAFAPNQTEWFRVWSELAKEL